MKKITKINLLSILALLTVCGCKNNQVSQVISSSGTGGDVTSANSETSQTSGGTSTNVTITPAPKIVITGKKDDDEQAIYKGIFGDFSTKYKAAKDLVDVSQRYVQFAEAEAALLDTAAFVPTTTNGGSYAITHAAYRSLPYAQSGYDSEKLKSAVVSKKLITKAERDEMAALWDKAKATTGGKYDPKAYLVSKGHEIDTVYKATFSSIPATLDIHDTSLAGDTDYIVQGVDGLVEYDNLGNIGPAIATSWEISENKLEYTFHLREDAKWYRNDGTVYGAVTAQDFVDGFHHMLDTKSGLGDLIKDVVKNAKRYVKGQARTFDEVGIAAVDSKTLKITLTKETPYFLSMLTYSPFAPMNGTFFQNQGGAFGISEFKKAKSNSSTYNYGKKGHPETILYNGAFHCSQMDDQSKIVYDKNDGYYNAANTNIARIEYIYNDGSNITQLYDDVVRGAYVGIGLNEDLIKIATGDGRFATNAYVSNTGTTTYFLGYNLYRLKYDTTGSELDSKKDASAQEKTKAAMLNKNFRKAMTHALDKKTWNGTTSGKDLAEASLRNIYTAPTFVSLEKEVTYNGHKFAKGTEYGDLVQYFIDSQYGGTIKCADAKDGTYNPTLAKQYMAQAVKDLEAEDKNFFSKPVQIDIINYAAQESSKNQCNSYKTMIEEVLGKDKIQVNILDTTNLTDFYNASYYANFGSDVCYDTYWGSGWGPDFADPSSYLSTFLTDGEGYMTKVVGLF